MAYQPGRLGAMTTREAILAVITDNPGITEAEMRKDPRIQAVPANGVRPGRMRLWLDGRIQPSTEAGWKRALANRVKDVGWRAVDDPAEQAIVGARAQTRQTRNARSVEERARRAAADLADPVVFRLFQQMTRDNPAQTRAAQRRRERTLRQQEMLRKAEAKRAERERAANADFKRKLALLWDARSTIAAIDQHLIEERARVADGRPRKITNIDWVIALRDVVMILQSFGSIWRNIRDLGDDLACPVCGAPQRHHERHLRPFAIDGEAEEIVVDAQIAST